MLLWMLAAIFNYLGSEGDFQQLGWANLHNIRLIEQLLSPNVLKRT